jgi:hypothetical protein
MNGSKPTAGRRLCLVTLLAVGSFAIAAPAETSLAPATRPARGEPTTQQTKQQEFLSKFVPTEQEISDTTEFIKANSPNHYQAMTSKKVQVNKFMVRLFLDMQRLKTDDPPLWELRLKEIQKVDEMFPVVRKLRMDPQDDVAHSELTALATELVDLRVKEAEHRIARLQDALTNEQNLLSELHGTDIVPNVIKEYLNGEIPLVPSGTSAGIRRRTVGSANPATQPAAQTTPDPTPP